MSYKRLNDLNILNNQLLKKVEELQEQIRKIKGALGTEEEGENLIDVARAAHDAEQRMASLLLLVDNIDQRKKDQ